MKDLRTAFLVKYPKYEIILNMYSKANDCPATWENLSKVRLQAFVDYMEERLAPNSVRQYEMCIRDRVKASTIYTDRLFIATSPEYPNRHKSVRQSSKDVSPVSYTHLYLLANNH